MIEKLKALKFEGNILKNGYANEGDFETQEGQIAVDDAIQFLEKQAPMEKLQRILVLDKMFKSRFRGHRRLDVETISDAKQWYEDALYGTVSAAGHTKLKLESKEQFGKFLQILIDDGNEKRVNRKLMFDQ